MQDQRWQKTQGSAATLGSANEDPKRRLVRPWSDGQDFEAAEPAGRGRKDKVEAVGTKDDRRCRLARTEGGGGPEPQIEVTFFEHMGAGTRWRRRCTCGACPVERRIEDDCLRLSDRQPVPNRDIGLNNSDPVGEAAVCLAT